MRWQRIVFSVTVTEGLLTEVFEKRKGCGRKAITPVVARILSGDSTSPLTRDGHGCPKLNAQGLCKDAKPTERSYGKGEGAEQWIVQFWEGWTERVGLRDCLFLLV